MHLRSFTYFLYVRGRYHSGIILKIRYCTGKVTDKKKLYLALFKGVTDVCKWPCWKGDKAKLLF